MSGEGRYSAHQGWAETREIDMNGGIEGGWRVEHLRCRPMARTVTVVLVLFVLLVGGCASAPGPKGVDLGEECTLAVGQSAVVAGGDLEIRFVEVLEDSRCPKGAACVWEGRVDCMVEVKEGDSSQQIKLTQSGLTDEYAEETYGDYRFAFKVEPYPEEGKEISSGEYGLLLRVSKP